MRESALVKAILARVNVLRKTGVPIKAYKTYGSIYTDKGTPDIHITLGGRSIWIEAKQEGKHPTKLQTQRLKEWEAAGAVTDVIHSIDEFNDLMFKYGDGR